MIEPTPPQLERLKEIIREEVHDSFEATRAMNVALAVWREAQEEKELLKKQHDFQVDQMEEVRAVFRHGADDDQWKPGATIAETIRGLIKDKQQLEASLKEKQNELEHFRQLASRDIASWRDASEMEHEAVVALEVKLSTAKRLLNAQELRLRELGENPSEAVAVIGEPVHPAIRERDDLQEEVEAQSKAHRLTDGLLGAKQKEVFTLEASLKLAVEALTLIYSRTFGGASLKYSHERIAEEANRTLSTIRTNHPALFPEG